jgi:hypothetical protein
MPIRSLLLIGVAGVALSGCYRMHTWRGHELKVISTLTCPDRKGDLTRTAAAADGKSCAYSGPDGAVVNLQLVSLNGGDAKAALDPIEAQLRTEVPASGSSDADNNGPNQGRVDIDLPGVHIHASGHDTDNDHVSIGGNGGNTVVESKGVQINAGDKGAEIHVSEPGGGVREDFILASETPGPNGFKAVGLQARGPSSGPLVVATLRAKGDDHDELDHDIRGLVRESFR